MNGVYTEKLPNYSQGKLEVTKDSWYIEFYFKGPDFRYNGTFVKICEFEIQKYINAFIFNFKKYLELKSQIPAGTTYEIKGELNMEIRIGGPFREGVCIKSYHLPISSKEDLYKIVYDLQWAQKRAVEIKNVLKSI
ncbi:hypothetical protein AWM68_17470 [Fictibacillus phosphorivorans]|uniref:Uncharacterized protein n=1 Tax=Fictibacillus phosphorivorans TaxID=1221500 RepID=A0A163S1K0_9BACL|nr:hypothetical protein [Fictibacillus phosphorivorans]KZE67962.1 hypothetical protein AWM68_17470 [Fictibacillus phosphorivorans]